MELEELQSAWTQLSNELRHQKKLTDEIIFNMTKENYRNKFRTLLNFESFGALICFAYAIFIILNLTKLDTWYLVVCGILALLFSIVLPVLGLKFIFDIKNLDILNGKFRQNILNYTRAKNNLLRLQKIGIASGFVVFFLMIVLNSKILSGKDIFLLGFKTSNWIGLLIGLTFMAFFCRWGYRKYKKITTAAEAVLRELE